MTSRASVRIPIPLACAVVAVELAAGVVGLARLSPGSSSPRAATRSVVASASVSSPPAADLDAGVAQLVAWVRRALPPTSPLLADPAVAAALRQDGFSAVSTPDTAGTVRFVVSTPTLRAAAGERPAVARALESSQPVAVIGTGTDALAVRQVSAVTPSQLSSDAANRLGAEGQLLANPAVHASSQAAGVLRSGGLDLRAAAVLALLASSGPVDLVAVQVDRAELAAGRPARVVDLRTSSVPTLRRMLAAAADAYRLASVTTRPGGVQRLTWPVDVTSGGNP